MGVGPRHNEFHQRSSSSASTGWPFSFSTASRSAGQRSSFRRRNQRDRPEAPRGGVAVVHLGLVDLLRVRGSKCCAASWGSFRPFRLQPGNGGRWRAAAWLGSLRCSGAALRPRVQPRRLPRHGRGCGSRSGIRRGGCSGRSGQRRRAEQLVHAPDQPCRPPIHLLHELGNPLVQALLDLHDLLVDHGARWGRREHELLHAWRRLREGRRSCRAHPRLGCPACSYCSCLWRHSGGCRSHFGLILWGGSN